MMTGKLSMIENFNPLLYASTFTTIYILLTLYMLRKPSSRVPLYRLSILVAVIGFIVINFLTTLPTFIVIENLTYATLLSIALIFSDGRGGRLLSLLLSMFVAGRVSRSIIGSDGTLQPYALRHIPLELHLVFIGLASWILIAMQRNPLLELPEPKED
ncbi:MAG: hypothetical protein LRS47_02310 [Desulfurococcales archaeon]|nr:hypothetical protein [Desulfurococcales archaeon]